MFIVFCDLCVVEDEFHFVFHLPLCNDLRNCLFEKIELKNLDLFWLSDADVLSWLFNMEIFVLARCLAAKTENIVPIVTGHFFHVN